MSKFIYSLTTSPGDAKIRFVNLKKSEHSGDLLYIIHRYNNDYVNKDLLPALYCSLNDGSHLPLVSKEVDDNVYLYCLTCGWEKLAGWVTADTLLLAMSRYDQQTPLVDNNNIL